MKNITLLICMLSLFVTGKAADQKNDPLSEKVLLGSTTENTFFDGDF